MDTKLTLDERLTYDELRLWRAIRRECRLTGSARSLYQVGVLLAELEYCRAHAALAQLEKVEHCVDVLRAGPGLPLVMIAREEP